MSTAHDMQHVMCTAHDMLQFQNATTSNYKLDYTNHGAFNISAPEGYKPARTHNEGHTGAMCLHEDYL